MHDHIATTQLVLDRRAALLRSSQRVPLVDARIGWSRTHRAPSRCGPPLVRPALA